MITQDFVVKDLQYFILLEDLVDPFKDTKNLTTVHDDDGFNDGINIWAVTDSCASYSFVLLQDKVVRHIDIF